jgi:MFS superfamily sulfate permease-like transporter
VKDQLCGDVVGGILGGVMNITKGTAYAQLAGIPPVNGLYALTLASFVYPVFASWSQGSMCAFAIIQLMCGAAAEDVMQNYNETALDKEITPATVVSTITFLNGVMFVRFYRLFVERLFLHRSRGPGICFEV